MVLHPREDRFKELRMPKDSFYQLTSYICPEIKKELHLVSDRLKNLTEEIRLRANRPLMLLGDGEEYFIQAGQGVTRDISKAMIVSKEAVQKTLQLIANYSLYAVEEELRQGYITLPGGHRVGIVGRAVLDGKGIKTLKDFSGLNLRISREKQGVANSVLPYLISGERDCYSTLIVSPPQCGKTTLLRDLIRNLSNGVPALNFKGMKVGVVDERSEIGGAFQGEPQRDLGLRTDLLDGCPKAQGMMMLIRAMSPALVATDEIGKKEDSYAIHEALLAGIKVMTTVHGQSLQDIQERPIIGELVQGKVFDRLIFLSNRQGVGTIEGILEGKSFQKLLPQPLPNRMVN